MKTNHNACFIEQSKLFFSLLDYRNNYFISDNPDHVKEFYNTFSNNNTLIEWMREKPKGNYVLKEFEGRKDIIVVIPTIDANGSYANNCRHIFNDLHIIFVESGYYNLYFNYAHNCNAGIKKALEYNPKWVIISNDDVKTSFTSLQLSAELSNLDYSKINTVFTRRSTQSSSKMAVCKLNLIGKIVFGIIERTHLEQFFSEQQKSFIIPVILNKRFKNKFIICAYNRIAKIFFTKYISYYNFEAFGLFSSEFIRTEKEIFDETYINAHEDQDLSMRMSIERERIAWIECGINGYGGKSFGNGLQRSYRTIASDTYLNYKISNDILLQKIHK